MRNSISWIGLTVICLLSFKSYSQVGADYTYQFLNLPSSPVQAALGGKNFTSSTNVSQAFWNPALINEGMNNQLEASFSRVYGAANYGSLGYSKTFRSKHNLFVGVNYLNYGDMEGYDEFGSYTGSFQGNEVALTMGSSYQIEQSDWYVGANVKFVFSALESYQSIGAAIDLGVRYRDEIGQWDFAFTARNLGAQLKTYADYREKLPLDVAISVSKELENVPLRWHITIDNLQQWDLSFSNPNRGTTSIDEEFKEEKVRFFNNALRHFIVGVELFPRKKFQVRLGYNFRKGEELRIVDNRHFAGISAGVGLQLKRFKFNYSYARQTTAANTSMFGVCFDMN
ncbi:MULTISPECIES: type IX secretion system protein PorQ [unclassified Myroides]|uniref:type IX secretion system protein PorQ n=1 Tax=unclassified Myroides TaxID=2642485 RepID=UPI003D2F53E0